MARKNPPAKWVLPDVVAPETSRCIKVMVPDEPHHIAAFRGAMLALAAAYNWSDDVAHTAKDVALVWRDVVDAMDWGCDDVTKLTDVRQNEDNPCTLQKTYDGSEWTDFADLRLCPPKVRLRGGVLEYSTDGGTTWQTFPDGNTDPTYDPRTDCFRQPNRTPVSGQDDKCLASVNAVNVFLNLHHEVCGWFTQGGLALLLGGVLAGIFLILFSGPLGVSVCVAIAALILEYSAGLVYSDFDDTVKDRLRCIFYCHVDNNGNFSDSEYAKVLEDIQDVVTELDSAIWHLIQIYVRDVAGIGGLNNAAKTTVYTTADCTDCAACEVCYEWDFSTGDDHGWNAYYGSAIRSNGWEDGDLPDGLYIDLHFDTPISFTKIEYEFNVDWNGHTPILTVGGVSIPDVTSWLATTTEAGASIIKLSVTASAVSWISIAADRWSGDVQRFGTMRLTKLRIKGPDLSPLTPNC